MHQFSSRLHVIFQWLLIMATHSPGKCGVFFCPHLFSFLRIRIFDLHVRMFGRLAEGLHLLLTYIDLDQIPCIFRWIKFSNKSGLLFCECFVLLCYKTYLIPSLSFTCLTFQIKETISQQFRFCHKISLPQGRKQC